MQQISKKILFNKFIILVLSILYFLKTVWKCMIYTYLRFNIYVKPLTHSQFKHFNTKMCDTILVKFYNEVIELYEDINSVKNNCFKYTKKTRSD